MSGLHKVMLKAGGLPRFRGLAQVMMLMMMGQRVVAVGKADETGSEGWRGVFRQPLVLLQSWRQHRLSD